ncbi:MAG: SCO family protein [Bosea sp.]|jgi:protein SCO1/2|nr:SCO family protein [Bosea sp. (in: a-proteobacteria)]
MDKRALILPAAAFLFGLVSLGLAALWTFAPTPEATRASSVGGPFDLTAMDGRRISSRQFQGAPLLVFFGFTHCPDVCPTKLMELSEVFRAAGDRAGNTRALFITVDPARDTPELLKNYLGSFDPRIIGLTGTQEEIDAVVKAFRAYARKVPTASGDYTMDHTAIIYLMDKKGQFVGSFNLERPPAEAARDLLRHL